MANSFPSSGGGNRPGSYQRRNVDPFAAIRRNHRIKVPQVRLISPEGRQLGISDTQKAISLALEVGLDLVEVAVLERARALAVADGMHHRHRAGHGIAAGENAMSLTDFRAMFDARAVDFAQPSVTKIGGISEMMRIARLAQERGVTLVPHSPYFGPGLLATVHMATAFEHETMVEYSFVELGASPLGDAIEIIDGRLKVPTGPGLGRDPDAEIIARYKVD